MSIGYLIVALALSTVHHDVHVQPNDTVNFGTESRDAGGILLASGNPWAAPVPEAERPRDSKQGSELLPPVQTTRPRYITPEELKTLDHLPQDRAYGQAWQPLKRDGWLNERKYRAPYFSGPGYYNQGGYPLDGGYGYPSYPGVNPLTGPYGGAPYGDVPYQGLMPFIY